MVWVDAAKVFNVGLHAADPDDLVLCPDFFEDDLGRERSRVAPAVELVWSRHWINPPLWTSELTREREIQRGTATNLVPGAIDYAQLEQLITQVSARR